jgi:hypothetical protein
VISVRGDVGVAGWISCAGKLPWGQPSDQRPDDAFSLTYDWEPLADELTVLGHPRLRLTLTPAAPVHYLSARVCDVFPDGTSALVSRGVLDLAHRAGHERPAPLEPGVATPVELELEVTSWCFEPGHRVRLALAGADWPNTWPPPAGGELTVERTSVELTLPVLDGPSPVSAPPLPPACDGDPHTPESDEPEGPVTWTVSHDVLARQTRARIAHGSTYAGPFGARVTERYEGEVGVSVERPGEAWAAGTAVYRVGWPEADVVAEARLVVRSDEGAYHVAIDLTVEELGDAGIGRRERRFERIVPRRLA